MTESQSPANWAAILGRWAFAGKKVTYLGPDDDRPESTPIGICVTNIQLVEGR